MAERHTSRASLEVATRRGDQNLPTIQIPGIEDDESRIAAGVRTAEGYAGYSERDLECVLGRGSRPGPALPGALRCRCLEPSWSIPWTPCVIVQQANRTQNQMVGSCRLGPVRLAFGSQLGSLDTRHESIPIDPNRVFPQVTGL
jgi:hypothetical protein